MKHSSDLIDHDIESLLPINNKLKQTTYKSSIIITNPLEYLSSIIITKPLKYLAFTLLAIFAAAIIFFGATLNDETASESIGQRQILSELMEDKLGRQAIQLLHDVEAFYNEYQSREFLATPRYKNCLFNCHITSINYALNHAKSRSEQKAALKRDIHRACVDEFLQFKDPFKSEVYKLIQITDGTHGTSIKDDIVKRLDVMIDGNLEMKYNGHWITHTYNSDIISKIESYKQHLNLKNPNYGEIEFGALLHARNALSDAYAQAVMKAFVDTERAFNETEWGTRFGQDISYKKEEHNVKAQWLQDNYPEYLEERIGIERVINEYLDLKKVLKIITTQLLITKTMERLQQLLTKGKSRNSAMNAWMTIMEFTNDDTETAQIIPMLMATKAFMTDVVLKLHPALNKRYKTEIDIINAPPQPTPEQQEKMTRSCRKGIEGCIDYAVYVITAAIYIPQAIIVHGPWALNPIVFAYGVAHLQYISTAAAYIPMKKLQLWAEGNTNSGDRVYPAIKKFLYEKISHAFDPENMKEGLVHVFSPYKVSNGKHKFFIPWEGKYVISETAQCPISSSADKKEQYQRNIEARFQDLEHSDTLNKYFFLSGENKDIFG